MYIIIPKFGFVLRLNTSIITKFYITISITIKFLQIFRINDVICHIICSLSLTWTALKVPKYLQHPSVLFKRLFASISLPTKLWYTCFKVGSLGSHCSIFRSTHCSFSLLIALLLYYCSIALPWSLTKKHRKEQTSSSGTLNFLSRATNFFLNFIWFYIVRCKIPMNICTVVSLEIARKNSWSKRHVIIVVLLVVLLTGLNFTFLPFVDGPKMP